MLDGEEADQSKWVGKLPVRLMLMSAILLVVGVVSIGLAVQFELVSFQMAALAFLVCGISSLLAHVAGEYPSGDDNFAARLALSMAVRTGPPFLLVILLKINSDSPLPKGFVVLIVLFYIVGLSVDVSMQSLRLNRAG